MLGHFRVGRRRGLWCLFNWREVFFACTAHGADPVIRDIRPGRARRYAAIRITLLGIVDPATDVADVALNTVRHDLHLTPSLSRGERVPNRPYRLYGAVR